MWILTLLFPVAAAQADVPEYRTCSTEMALAFDYAETLFDDLCPQPNGASQVFSQASGVVIEQLNRRLSPTAATIENEDLARPNLLNDTQLSPHQLSQIVLEDVTEAEFCLRQLCGQVSTMCSTTAEQNRASAIAFQAECPRVVSRLMKIQHEKAATLLRINSLNQKAVARSQWALHELRGLVQAWISVPMLDILGDAQDFATNTTGLINNPKK